MMDKPAFPFPTMMTDNLEKARECYERIFRLGKHSGSGVMRYPEDPLRYLAAFRRAAVVEGLRMAANEAIRTGMNYWPTGSEAQLGLIEGVATEAAANIRALADEMEGK